MTCSPDQLRIIYLPGMQGEAAGDRWIERGLIDAGAADTRIFDWVESWWPLKNLRNRENHKRAAAKLAEKLRELVDDGEGKKHVLLGHSTGAMVILDLLEHFDEPVVDLAWFLSAAVSRGYDLRPALGGTKRLVNVYSPVDYVVLNLGTKLFGSADGEHEECAGHQPFNGPGREDARLEQIAYDPQWLKAGHYGGHLGPMATVTGAYARDVLLPLICERA